MSYTIVQADLEKDKDDILKFWKENRSRPLDDKYEWMYEGNPAGKAKTFILKCDEDNKYVGVTSLFPRSFLVNGKVSTAGIAGDFLINQEHRTVGPAIMLQRSALSAANGGGLDFLYGFPNKSAEPIMKRVGFKILGPKSRFVKIIKTAPKLKRKRLNKYLIGILSPILDFTLKLISIETWCRSSKGFVCKEVGDFDERFDQLWESEKSKFMIVGDRAASFLKWKFLNDPDDAHKIFAVFDFSESVLKGYIIYRWDENAIDIRDFLFSEDKKAVLLLVTTFLRHARSLGPESIEITFLKNDYIVDLMKRFGFMEVENSGNVYFHHASKSEAELTLLENRNNWFLMRSDEDA